MLVEKRLKKQKNLVARKALHKQVIRKTVAKKVIHKMTKTMTTVTDNVEIHLVIARL